MFLKFYFNSDEVCVRHWCWCAKSIYKEFKTNTRYEFHTEAYAHTRHNLAGDIWNAERMTELVSASRAQVQSALFNIHAILFSYNFFFPVFVCECEVIFLSILKNHIFVSDERK